MNTAKIVRTAGIAIASLLVAGGVVAVTAYAAGVNLVPKAAASPSPSATPGKVSAPAPTCRASSTRRLSRPSMTRSKPAT